LRILVLSAWYPPHHLGGYEIACQAAVRGLSARGHELEILASRFRLPDREGPDEARRVLNLFWEDGRWRRPGLGGAVVAAGEDLRAFRGAVDGFRPDVLWVWHMGAISKVLLAEAYARGLPYVLSLLDLWPVYDLPPDPWLRWCHGLRAPVGLAIGRARGYPSRVPRLAADAAGAAYCSTWLQDVLAGKGVTARGRVIYPGIDPSRFPPGPPLEHPVRRFLQVGRIEPRKGQAIAVEALGKLHAGGYRDTTLTFAGAAEGGHDAELRALAGRAGVGDAVRFAGPVPPEDLARVYAEHDAAIHAATWQEPFGLVLVEAMATGRPLLCSPTGGAREIVTPNVDALTFEPGDASGLAARMEAVAADPSLAARLARAGLRTAERFTEDRASAEHESMLLDVVASRR
jgi:glycosyltransferase involved in cell wall biosynthesis